MISSVKFRQRSLQDFFTKLCLHSSPQNIFLFTQWRALTVHSGKVTRWENLFIFKFSLEYPWFARLCKFFLYSLVNQLYKHMYQLFKKNFFPIQVIAEYSIEFPMLHSRSLIKVLCIRMGVWSSRSPLYPSHPPPSFLALGNFKLAFSICVFLL